MKIIAAVALVLALSLPGCTPSMLAQLVPILADVALAIAQAEPEVKLVEAEVATYFAAHPNPAAQQKAIEAIGKLRSSLVLAARSVHAAQSLTQADLDLAFADFKIAWIELQRILEEDGIVRDGRFAISPGGHSSPSLPEPIAFHLTVRR